MEKAMYLTPVVTAFDRDNNLDIQGNKNIWEHLIKGGIDGIVLMGSTGEFYSMTMEMKKELIDLAITTIKKRVKLYVGTGCMTVEETVELSNYALNKGADAVMIVGPYYFALSPESIEYYFDTIAKKINGDIFLYNYPERTGYDLTAEITLNLIRKNKNIVGFKDTVSEMGHTRKLLTTIREEFPHFVVLSGYDENLAHLILSGGNGCIGALSNLYPEIFSKWVKALNTKDFEEVSRIQKVVNKLMKIYEIGNPFITIVKKAMILRGIELQENSIKPFLKATDKEIEQIKQLMETVEKNI
ncbi:dihydrodipicolinate synthase family protein [Fusobacterium sp. SYSU M8D902]|uniref:dihydrodipicolinate synthase family protein n=1 Tax=Fusobacterium sp. SYSU M8D902 TaxID=3159562 RepID=UPI0032E36936